MIRSLLVGFTLVVWIDYFTTLCYIAITYNEDILKIPNLYHPTRMYLWDVVIEVEVFLHSSPRAFFLDQNFV